MISDDICKLYHIKEITVSIAFKQKCVNIEKIASKLYRMEHHIKSCQEWREKLHKFMLNKNFRFLLAILHFSRKHAWKTHALLFYTFSYWWFWIVFCICTNVLNNFNISNKIVGNIFIISQYFNFFCLSLTKRIYIIKK